MSTPANAQDRRPHVVVVGAGFAGLECARRLISAPVDVTIIARDNYHGFWPLLYQVATGGLGVDDIARPVRALFGRHSNVTTVLGEVTDVDLASRRLRVAGQPDLTYDYLVLAAGSASADFGIPGVAEHTFPLKTLEDAVSLRSHLLSTWERAEADPGVDPQAALCVVLVGGGPTGVELSGALAEFMHTTLQRDYRRLRHFKPRVVLVEMTPHLLPGFAPGLQEDALRVLRQKKVDVKLGAKLARVGPGKAVLEDGTNLSASTIVWTAGVVANLLAHCLPGEKGQGGTVRVNADLSLPGHPGVFVVGDMAAAMARDPRRYEVLTRATAHFLGRRAQVPAMPCSHEAGQLPQLARVAVQGGRHAAAQIARLHRAEPTLPFKYRDHGIMATIGRREAVAQLPGGITIRGTWGWLAWLVVHLVFLIGFRNRAVVMVSWAYNYVTWDRSARALLRTERLKPRGRAPLSRNRRPCT